MPVNFASFAAFLTLINDARFLLSKPSLGFVNPALYHFASVPRSEPVRNELDVVAVVAGVVGEVTGGGGSPFFDITKGKNNCCAAVSNPVCCPDGFTAAIGWDPVTGLGSVNFTALKQAFLAM